MHIYLIQYLRPTVRTYYSKNGKIVELQMNVHTHSTSGWGIIAKTMFLKKKFTSQATKYSSSSIPLEFFFKNLDFCLVRRRPQNCTFLRILEHYNKLIIILKSLFFKDAKNIWNNLLEPVGAKSDWSQYSNLKCPTSERPFLATNKNSAEFSDDNNDEFDDVEDTVSHKILKSPGQGYIW